MDTDIARSIDNPAISRRSRLLRWINKFLANGSSERVSYARNCKFARDAIAETQSNADARDKYRLIDFHRHEESPARRSTRNAHHRWKSVGLIFD